MLRTRTQTCARRCRSGHPVRNRQIRDVTRPHYRGGRAAVYWCSYAPALFRVARIMAAGLLGGQGVFVWVGRVHWQAHRQRPHHEQPASRRNSRSHHGPDTPHGVAAGARPSARHGRYVVGSLRDCGGCHCSRGNAGAGTAVGRRRQPLRVVGLVGLRLVQTCAHRGGFALLGVVRPHQVRSGLARGRLPLWNLKFTMRS